MNSGLNSALHYALCCETQCHALLSQSCLGLQVTSCLPVFLSSGTAGAINQLPLSPVVSVWPGLTTNNNNIMGLSHLVRRSFRGHFFSHTKIVFELNVIRRLFPGFQDKLSKSQVALSCCKTFKKKKKSLFIDGFVILLRTQSSPWEQFYDASDGHKLICCWSHSTQHVQSQAFLPLQMESIEAHYCVLGGVSSTMNSLAHF